MDLDALGKRIRSRREGRGLKQSDLAAALRVSPQAVSKWERGENAPDISVLVNLARMLDVGVEWLLGGAVAERETFEAVVFVTGIGDFAARVEDMSPAAVAAWTNGMFLTVTEALLQFDGVPVKYVGDGFLGFFTGADMKGRAVAAAMRAQQLVAEPRFAIALTAGDVYLGSIGHPDYATPDILGATVNAAFMQLPRVLEHCASGVGVAEAFTSDAFTFTPRAEGLFEPEAR
ncbi:MAG: helix-turn-helix domain-containing protein [Deltaproteobacteria bacterium]|jgi:class 3 adenylate cyclase